MLKRPTILLSVFMIGVVSAMAITALFTDLFAAMLPGNRRWMFGGVLLAYAVLRLLRLKKVVESEKEPKQ